MSLFFAHCSSNSLRFNFYVLMMIFVKREEFIFFVLVSDQSLAQGRSQLEPFGSVGLVKMQGITEVLLISHFLLALFMMCSRSSSRTESKPLGSLAASNFVFFCCPFIYGFALRVFRHA